MCQVVQVQVQCKVNMAFKTQRYKLDYFNKGSFYRADADYRRFVTLDYNLESYIGIVGVGVIKPIIVSTQSSAHSFIE